MRHNSAVNAAFDSFNGKRAITRSHSSLLGPAISNKAQAGEADQIVVRLAGETRQRQQVEN